MDIMLLLLYAGFCWAIFKIFKIPLNKWSVPTAVLGGVVFLGFLLFTMNYSHPYGKYAKEVYVSVPIVAPVAGIVTEVAVEDNVEVEEGTVLFKIDPKPYEFEVKRLEAKLVDAKQIVKQSEAALNRAKSQVEQAKSARDRTQAGFERVLKVGARAVSQQEIDVRRELFEAAQAKLEAAISEMKRIELIYTSKIDGVNTIVIEVEAQLDRAKYDLERTVVRAPSKGMVTQLTLRPGQMAATLPLRPALVFVPTERRFLAASFWQNSLPKLEEGAMAEVSLDALPGRIISGKVTKKLNAIPEAEVQVSGTQLSSEFLKKSNRAIAIIELDEDLNEIGVPLGVQGKAAVISEDDPIHSAPIRRILLRMLAWLNYLYPIK